METEGYVIIAAGTSQKQYAKTHNINKLHWKSTDMFISLFEYLIWRILHICQG